MEILIELFSSSSSININSNKLIGNCRIFHRNIVIAYTMHNKLPQPAVFHIIQKEKCLFQNQVRVGMSTVRETMEIALHSRFFLCSVSFVSAVCIVKRVERLRIRIQ